MKCGLCAKVCPMGSINPENVAEVTGICIKCGVCVKKCPTHAKHFDDPNYNYHKTELEKTTSDALWWNGLCKELPRLFLAVV